MEALINYLLQFGHLNQQQIDLVKSKGVLARDLQELILHYCVSFGNTYFYCFGSLYVM